MLTSDGNRFGRNWGDDDIVTEAALAVIAAEPDSTVGVLTKGKVPLTAFIPNDWSFRKLAKELTGTRFTTEKQIFNALAGWGSTPSRPCSSTTWCPVRPSTPRPRSARTGWL